MAESDWQPVMGTAQRRRQRRLRSWWRHEQQSIAAALATVMHHTANGAAEEEVEYDPHYAPRGQKTPAPGERPAPLSEVAGPQRSDRTVRTPREEAPLLVMPSLRGADGVDGTTVSFLLAENLELQKKKEEKERRWKREEAQHEARMRELDRRVMADEQLNPAESYAWCKWRGFLPSEPRRKKKRKKKKLPCAPRPRQGCRRLCDHQRQVPVVRFPVMMQRQVPTVHSFMLLVQFLDMVLDMPVVVLRQVPGLMVQKTVVRPQLPSIYGRRHSLSSSRGSSHGPGYSPDHRDSPVAVRFQVVDVPVVPGRAGSQVLLWRRPWRSHSCSSLGNLCLATFPCIWQSLVRCLPSDRILDFSG